MKIFKMNFFEHSFEKAVNELVLYIKTGTKFEVAVTVNSDHCLKLSQLQNLDKVFVSSYRKAKWHFADGMPIVILSKLLGKPLKERITGADLTPALLQVCDENKFKIAVIASNMHLLLLVKEHCKLYYPNLEFVYGVAASFPFDPLGLEAEQIAKDINSSNSDIILIGLGFPKQEKWLFNYGHMTNAKIGIGIGAALEFMVKEKPRAPKWMQNLGLEFLHRAFTDRRLIARYLKNLDFFRLAIKELIVNKP